MAILQALLAALSRSAGKFLNTVFSWATTLLFGKVPPQRQTIISLTGLGSVLWAVALVGTIFPDVAAFLFSFVTVPEWAEPYVQMVMLALTILLPLIIGALSLTALAPEARPKSSSEKFRALLRGYPYVIGLSLTLILLCISAPLLKLRTIIKRWDSAHIPIVIEADKYGEIVEFVRGKMEKGGYKTVATPASFLIRFPTRILTFFSGSSVNDLMAKELKLLKSDIVEVLIHPSDIVLNAQTKDLTKVRALLSKSLGESAAYLCWSKDAQELEDAFDAVVKGLPQGTNYRRQLIELRVLAKQFDTLEVEYDEWVILYRLQLQAEATVLRKMLSLKKPDEPSEPAPENLAIVLASVAAKKLFPNLFVHDKRELELAQVS